MTNKERTLADLDGNKISKEEVEMYLSDLDNLLDCGKIPAKEIEDHTYHYKGKNLKEFIEDGREILRKVLIKIKCEAND